MAWDIYQTQIGSTPGGVDWLTLTAYPNQPIWGLIRKYRPAPTESQIIGLTSATMITEATDGVNTLTQTIFDTTTRPDSARILLTNSTGASVTIRDVAIYGKIRKRVQGRIHDKFVDYASISRDGERLFELGNDFIVTLDQVNKLADYHWKLNRSKKHIYTLSMSGFHSYFEPGEWYTLSIGGAGQDEYISATVECYAVHCSMSRGGPASSVAFREVEEDWKHDSNETARFVASGKFTKSAKHGSVISVAASDYIGYADYYCDGTDDQEEWNNAYGALLISGGLVRGTEGTYTVSSSITPVSNTITQGDGARTIFRASGAFSAFQLVASSGSLAENVTIENLKIDRLDAGLVAAVNLQYVTNLNVRNLVMSGCCIGVYIGSECTGSIRDNDITWVNPAVTSSIMTVGVYLVGTSTITVSGNQIHDMNSPGSIYGIRMLQNDRSTFGDNKIYNLTGTSTSQYVYGMSISAPQSIIANNVVLTITNTLTTPTTMYACAIGAYGERSIVEGNRATDSDRGILNGADQNLLVANYCYNNGSDTGIANTNAHNYVETGASAMLTGNSWQ